MIKNKVCRHCDVRKSVGEFRLRKVTPDGFDTWCADCRTERERMRRDGDAKKICSMCREEKHLFMFYRESKSPDLKSVRCKDCARDYADKYRVERSPVDFDRICEHLKQPREGMSNSNLINLWVDVTDLYLPRLEDYGKPLISMVTGAPV